MTSLRKRFEAGEITPFLEFWKQHKGNAPLCCYTLEKQKDGKWKMKCDSSPWLEPEDFKEFCLKCQKEIEEILKRNGF